MAADSPWKTLKQAGERVHRGPRFLRREWAAGRLRAARIGGRGELFTTDAWIDQWMIDHATPIVIAPRRRA